MRERLIVNPKDQQRIDVLGRWREGSLTVAEVSALLACSERTAWRLLGRFRTRGVDGIVHGNRGRASPRRLPGATSERVLELARTRYRGVNDSPHDWLEGRGPRLTLVGAIDDATGAIVAATFAPVEDGRAYLTILARMCRDHGVPAAVYRDRSGIFAPIRRAGRSATPGPRSDGPLPSSGSARSRQPRRRPRAGSSASGEPARTASSRSSAWRVPPISTAPTSSW